MRFLPTDPTKGKVRMSKKARRRVKAYLMMPGNEDKLERFVEAKQALIDLEAKMITVR